jgi:hypothetical protein
MQSPQQQFQQLQFLNPQQQQQLLMQAQQNMASPTASDVDTRRLRMLLNNRNMVIGQDGQTNSGGDIIPNIGSPTQSGGSRSDIDMLIKVCSVTSCLLKLIFSLKYYVYLVEVILMHSVLSFLLYSGCISKLFTNDGTPTS